MKNLKIFILMAVAIAAGLFSACNDAEFEAGPGVDGMQTYFPDNVSTQYSISDDVSSIAIPVNRIVKDAAQSVAILSEDESGLFNIPSSVSFAAGKATADLVITFDRTKLVDGTEYALAFLINDENNTTPYGNRSLDIKVMPWPWEAGQTGKFREGWLGDVFSGNLFEIDVVIHEHKSKKGVYMIEDMFGWPYLTEFFEATQAQLSEQFSYAPSNITIDCSDPANVTITNQWTGITENTYNYGKFMIASKAAGTLDNKIITFPEKGLTCEFVGLGRTFEVNTGGTFRIMLPGAEIVDYALAAAYDGMKLSADGETASAIVDFAYGADVTGISYVFTPGNTIDKAGETAQAMIEGTIENIYEVEDFVVGAQKVSVETELAAAGVYTVTALPKNKAGELLADNVVAASFYFPGKGGSGAPECDIKAGMGLVSVFWPEQSAQYPDYSSLFFQLEGSELESLSTLLITTESLNDMLAEDGVTEELVVDLNGADRSTTFMTSINNKGFYGSAWINLIENTEYTLLVKATNIYGKKAIAKAVFSTTAVPYAGELVTGQYQMSYSEASGFSCENVFKVHPTAGSTTAFFVSGLGRSSSFTQWYATYDPAASTLTLDGKAKGFESNGNVFGRLSSNFDARGAYYYVWLSFADPKGSTKNDPLVFKVDPSTKQLSELTNYLYCPVYSAADDTHAGDLCLFPPATAVTKYNAAASPASMKIPDMRRISLPFSSGLAPDKIWGLFNSRIHTPDFGMSSFAKTDTDITVNANGIRTLRVKTAKCEPLPRQLGRSFELKESVK